MSAAVCYCGAVQPAWWLSMTRRSDRRRSGAKPAGRKGTAWLWGLGILFAVVVILGFRLVTPQPGDVAVNLRAALIDQLSPAFPNE